MIVLKATGRRFEIKKGSIETAAGGGYTEAKVQFLDLAQEEEEEEEEEVKRSVLAARRKNHNVNVNGEAYDRGKTWRVFWMQIGVPETIMKTLFPLSTSTIL